MSITNPRPHTLFKALINKGKKEVRDKTNPDQIARHAEHEEIIRIDWTDKRGDPVVWANLAGLAQYTGKEGWRVCGYGDFEEWLNSTRFDKTTPKYQEMQELYVMVRGLTGEFNENLKLKEAVVEKDTKIAELMARLAAVECVEVSDGKSAPIQESGRAKEDNRRIQGPGGRASAAAGSGA